MALLDPAVEFQCFGRLEKELAYQTHHATSVPEHEAALNSSDIRVLLCIYPYYIHIIEWASAQVPPTPLYLGGTVGRERERERDREGEGEGEMDGWMDR